MFDLQSDFLSNNREKISYPKFRILLSYYDKKIIYLGKCIYLDTTLNFKERYKKQIKNQKCLFLNRKLYFQAIKTELPHTQCLFVFAWLVIAVTSQFPNCYYIFVTQTFRLQHFSFPRNQLFLTAFERDQNSWCKILTVLIVIRKTYGCGVQLPLIDEVKVTRTQV